jgi:PKD repeat protein
VKTIGTLTLLFVTTVLIFPGCKEEAAKVDPPLADFTCDQVSGDPPLTVNFTSTSTGIITSYAWGFGNGETASTENAVHTYTEGGSYIVKFTVEGPGGISTSEKTINVNLPDPPVAGFTCDVNSGEAPLIVSFTSTSTGEITSYSWDFGDGDTSALINPAHTYSATGKFMAKLTVTGPGGSNSDDQSINVQAPSPPDASLTCDVTTGDAPLTVNFTSTSTGNITSYSWDFGDGEVSTLENPSHIYNNPGTFTAILEVTGPGGTDSAEQTINVTEVIITDITFTNPAFTHIHITLSGNTKIVEPGNSVTYNSVEGTNVSYTAYTYGETSTGTQVGEYVSWDNTINLSGGTTIVNLNVTDEYFYIYITNQGTQPLVKLYVNYGLSSQTLDNIVIPNNSVKYKTGYYKAFPNSNVRMYSEDNTFYVYWNQGTHFILPWTDNQFVSLLNTAKSGNNVFISDDSDQHPNLVHENSLLTLYPWDNDLIHQQKDPNSIDHYCK